MGGGGNDMCDVTHFLFFYHKHETDIGSDVSLNRMQFCILTEDVTLVTQSSPHTYIHTYITCMHALIHTCTFVSGSEAHSLKNLLRNLRTIASPMYFLVLITVTNYQLL